MLLVLGMTYRYWMFTFLDSECEGRESGKGEQRFTVQIDGRVKVQTAHGLWTLTKYLS
jgi:hypothetical protein